MESPLQTFILIINLSVRKVTPKGKKDLRGKVLGKQFKLLSRLKFRQILKRKKNLTFLSSQTMVLKMILKMHRKTTLNFFIQKKNN